MVLVCLGLPATYKNRNSFTLISPLFLCVSTLFTQRCQDNQVHSEGTICNGKQGICYQKVSQVQLCLCHVVEKHYKLHNLMLKTAVFQDWILCQMVVTLIGVLLQLEHIVEVPVSLNLSIAKWNKAQGWAQSETNIEYIAALCIC